MIPTVFLLPPISSGAEFNSPFGRCSANRVIWCFCVLVALQMLKGTGKKEQGKGNKQKGKENSKKEHALDFEQYIVNLLLLNNQNNGKQGPGLLGSAGEPI